MFNALDSRDNKMKRASLELEKGDCYRCIGCNQSVSLKYCTDRRPHFAHKTGNKACAYYNKNEMSEWHKDWQNRFDKHDCCELEYYTYDDSATETEKPKYRKADVMIKESNTVIEFQHSHMDGQEFYDRTKFYTDKGFNVVWVFHVYKHIPQQYDRTGYLRWDWETPFDTFKRFKEIKNNVFLYFEIDEYLYDVVQEDNDFKGFSTSKYITKDNFENMVISNSYTLNHSNNCNKYLQTDLKNTKEQFKQLVANLERSLKNKDKEWESKTKNLKNQNELYSNENNHLGAKIDDLEDEIRELKNELKAAKEENEHYRQETLNKQGKINQLEQEIYTLENYNSDKRKEYDKDDKSNNNLEYYKKRYFNSETFCQKFRPELIRLVLENNLRIDKDTFSAFYQANEYWLETRSFGEDEIEKKIVGAYKNFCKE